MSQIWKLYSCRKRRGRDTIWVQEAPGLVSLPSLSDILEVVVKKSIQWKRCVTFRGSGFCLLALFIPVMNFASYFTWEVLRQFPVTSI